MIIRNIMNVKNVMFAVGVIALAAPMAQAQTRRSNSIAGGQTATNKSHIYNGAKYGGTYTGKAYGYNPYTYSQGGALILGSDGRIYDPFAEDSGMNSPFYQNGVTISAPVRLSDQIEAVALSGNRVQIAWNGDTHTVSNIKFSLLDRRRKTLQSMIVTDLPAQATFARPSNAAYFRVVITYDDGAVRSLVSAL